MDPARSAELVNPFYLHMMRTNAIEHGAEHLPAIVELGRGVAPVEVAELLTDHWRPRVMGAWYALMHDDEVVTRAVLLALATSQGYLDSPPLATAAVVLAGAAALPAMESYLDNDRAKGWGGSGYVGAAVAHLREPDQPGVTAPDDFTVMLDLAERIRTQR